MLPVNDKMTEIINSRNTAEIALEILSFCGNTESCRPPHAALPNGAPKASEVWNITSPDKNTIRKIAIKLIVPIIAK